MTSLHCLVHVRPLNTRTGARASVYASSANLRDITGLGGVVWEPALVSPPVLNMKLFNGDFQASVNPGTASIPLQIGTLINSYPFANTCAWQGADVEIFAGESSADWPWRKVFSGKVSGYERKANVLTLTAEVAFDDKNVLTKTYAGTGGAEGDANQKGKLKPLVIGWPLNVEPALINSVDNVYQFSGYGPIEGVTKLYERASDFGAATGDHADYAALVAATIAPGKWATCLAEGMIRLGAPAYGVITADLKGHKVGSATPRLTGAVIAALADIAGIAADLLVGASLDALDLAAPYPINLLLTEQTKFLDIAKRLTLPCNFQSGVSLTGKYFAVPIGLAGTPTLTLDAQGRALPQVKESVENDVSVPYAKTVMGANRSWRVHTADEISSNMPIVPAGAYAAGTTYREGNVVTTNDEAEWIYIGATPSAGNAPPTWPTTSNAYWTNRKPPLDTTGVTYTDGSALEYLQPGEPGADVTANNQVVITLTADKSVAADYAGTVASGDLSAVLWAPTVMRGGTSIKLATGTTYALSNASGGTFAVDNTGGSSTKGNVTISAMTANTAQVDLTVTVDGVAQPKVTLRLAKVQGDPPATGSAGAYPKTVSWTGGDFTGIDTTSYTAVVATKTVTLASGESLYGTAPLDYNVSGATLAVRTMTFKWQYAVAGSGSWNDFGSGITGTGASSAYVGGSPDYIYYDPIPGSVAVTQTASSLSAGDYDVRLVALDSATGRTCTPSGTATIQAKV